jgi:hypothetical protein
MKVSMDKQYTSNGEPVRILCTDKAGEYPVVAIIEGCAYVITFTLEGKYRADEPCIEDLKEVPTPTEGELCYFWDYSNDSRGVVVRAFKYYSSSNKNYVYVDTTGAAWAYCAPFDGNLPEGFVK